LVSKTRTVRIAERIRDELSELLLKDIQDPRLKGVSITDVEVDRELAYATIFFSSIEGSTRAAEIQEAFEHAKGFLRSELSKRIELRAFPRLRFKFDPTLERAEKIENLFASIEKESKAKSENE
jgi:ribosome-binding factor A